MTAPHTDSASPDLVAITRMRNRVRVLRAVRGALEFAVWALALAIVALLGARLGWLGTSRVRAVLVGAAMLPLVGALAMALRAVPALLAAQLLDRHYALHDRLSAALEFRATPVASRTAWMNAAIDDAVHHATTTVLDPARALRWHWPVELRVVAALSALLALVGVAEFRVARLVASTSARVAAERDPLVLEDDDLDAFRAMSRELARNAVTPRARELVRSLDRFLDDVTHRRLEREEAFRRLATLQQALDQGREQDREDRNRALRDVGERMGDQSDAVRDLSQALRQGDLQRAREAAERLAARLREERQLSAQQRQELARALAQAAQQRNDPELQRRVEQARREVEEMLRRQREQSLSQHEEDLLRRRQRQAESLEREREQQSEQRRQVERLQRELSDAARELMRQMGDAPTALQQVAEELSRMQDEERSQQSLEEMRRQLEELRQQMRQQNGQNGQRQRVRLARFSSAARGLQRQQAQGQQGQQGQGGNQPGGNQPGGNPPGGNQPGASGSGQGGTTVTVVPGGTGVMPIPGGTMPGNQQGQRAGEHGNGGRSAGATHEENARGAAAQIAQATQSVQIHGQQTGNGPSRSQVIRTAASDGFASAPYRQVYAPYWDRAREVLHQGEVPAGYRSYVRRYFHLIRPRGDE